MLTTYRKNKYLFVAITTIALLASLISVRFSTKASATVLPTSATSPTITQVQEFPDIGAIRIHWSTPVNDSGAPITDYAYLIQGGSYYYASWVYLQQSYVVNGGDFSYTFTGLPRCDCITYHIQIAAVHGSQFLDPSRPTGTTFGYQDPAVAFTTPTPIPGGFTFTVSDWVNPSTYNLLPNYSDYYNGYSQPDPNVLEIPSYSYSGPAVIMEKPYIGPIVGNVVYGPSVYKLTGIFGSSTAVVTGPDQNGVFTVKGLSSGQTASVTIARHPVTCNEYAISYCEATTAATVTGTAG